jgi:hypothetical protein
MSKAEQMPPNSYGARQSGMMKAVNGGVAEMKDVNLTDKEKRILACWIDLEAPHAGSYSSYMSPADSTKYHSLEVTAQKWYDIEAQNVKEYAAWQAKNVVGTGHNSIRAAASAATQLNIRYLPTRHVLVSSKGSQGTFMLVDLRGKVISRIKLSHQNTGDVTISLPASLATGLYLARFEGVNGTAQAKISITK